MLHIMSRDIVHLNPTGRSVVILVAKDLRGGKMKFPGFNVVAENIVQLQSLLWKIAPNVGCSRRV